MPEKRKKMGQPTLPTGKAPLRLSRKVTTTEDFLSRAPHRRRREATVDPYFSLSLSLSHSRSAVEGSEKSLKVFESDTARKGISSLGQWR